ncbi:MAG: methyltransferase domain-containing protein [Acidobacteria bacterium]|nr:methyltransferase domain-containing protein [Acidobacteriota bacterium]
MKASRRVARLALGSIFAALCSLPAGAQNNILDPRTLAPFVPTPERIVEQMLSSADVTKDDTVYDLGSGDGRILFTAAQQFGAKAVGIEINQALVDETRARIAQMKLEDRVQVVRHNLLEADLTGATVVTVYLLSSTNEQLKPKLEAELQPGSRVVSHDFRFLGWKPYRTVEVPGETRAHRIYVYKMGEHREQ